MPLATQAQGATLRPRHKTFFPFAPSVVGVSNRVRVVGAGRRTLAGARSLAGPPARRKKRSYVSGAPWARARTRRTRAAPVRCHSHGAACRSRSVRRGRWPPAQIRRRGGFSPCARAPAQTMPARPDTPEDLPISARQARCAPPATARPAPLAQALRPWPCRGRPNEGEPPRLFPLWPRASIRRGGLKCPAFTPSPIAVTKNAETFSASAPAGNPDDSAPAGIAPGFESSACHAASLSLRREEYDGVRKR